MAAITTPASDRCSHEAAHLAAMKVFGFTADQLRFDLKYGDWGWFGGADGIRRTTGDSAANRSIWP